MSTVDRSNPLLQAWDEPFGLPPFERVRAEHFAPAFEQAMAAHRAEIVVQPQTPIGFVGQHILRKRGLQLGEALDDLTQASLGFG